LIILDDQQLVLGNGFQGTIMTLAVLKPGMMSLGLRNGRHVEIVDGKIRAGMNYTAFTLELVSDSGDVLIRTEDGLYLSALDVGAPITLSAHANPSTLSKFKRTQQFGEKWGADPGYQHDETYNTHLWSFNCAKDLTAAEMT
jgi:hypothetical protein